MSKFISSLVAVLLFCASSPISFATSSTLSDPVSNQPTGEISLSASLNSSNQIEFNWEITGTAPQGFKIAKSTQNENPTYPVMSGDSYFYISSPSKRDYIDGSVKAGETYHYRVCLYKGGSCGAYSEAIAITIPEGSTSDQTTGEISLSASLNSKNQVEFHWETTGNAPKGFKIAKSTQNKNPTYPVMSGDSYFYISNSGSRSYTDGSVKEGKTYYYRVCLYEGGYCGAYSGSVAITIPEESSDEIENEDQNQNNNNGTVTTPTQFAGFEDEVVTNSNTNPFSDNSLDSLEGKAAAELYRRGVIGGFPDGEFKGTRAVNRAEAAKFLLLAKGINVEDYKNEGKFFDVKDGEWYTKYVMKAYRLGIINGYANKSFGPEKTVNTAEFCKMLTLAFGLPQYEKYLYEDVAESAWFSPFVGVARKYNLFPNRSEYELKPNQNLTRNEVAAAIYQYLLNR